MLEFCNWNDFPADYKLTLSEDQILGIKIRPLNFGLFLFYFKFNDQVAYMQLKKKDYPELFEKYRDVKFDFRPFQKQQAKQGATVFGLLMFTLIASGFLNWALLSLIPFQILLQSSACQKDCVDTMHKFFIVLSVTYLLPVSFVVMAYFSIRYFSKKYSKLPLRLFMFFYFWALETFSIKRTKMSLMTKIKS